MSKLPDRDIEKSYPLPEFVAKLRRLADALENNERFDIQIAGERVYVPVRAVYSIEHEYDNEHEEIEFQIRWSKEKSFDILWQFAILCESVVYHVTL